MDCCVSDEPASEYFERRWFATLDALTAQEAECETLLEVMKLSESAWRLACERLTELHGLRNALEDEIDVLHGFKDSQALQHGQPQESGSRYQCPAPQPLRLSGQAV
jgi:hypothetical protein